MRLTLLFLLVSTVLFGQRLEPNNGAAPSLPKFIALKNATIYVSPNRKIERGTILIEGDKIVKIGPLVQIPDAAVVLDYTDKVIVPSFIDVRSELGITKEKKGHESNSSATYWNESIHPEKNTGLEFTYDEKKVQAYLQLGFGLVSVHDANGIAQGNASIYALGNKEQGEILIQDAAIAHFSFSKGTSKNAYPSSQMGSIALLRQALYDAKWYQTATDKTFNVSLESLNKQVTGKMFFTSNDKLEIMRAQAIATEFNLNFTYLGSGNEYGIADQLAQHKMKLVLPVNFPEAYDVNDPYVAKEISLKELKHWEMAPCNLFLLKEKGLTLALTSHGTADKDFWKNLKTLMECGVSADDVLAALTTIPAEMLGIQELYGDLEKGKKACFSVFSNNPFTEKAEVLESWIEGVQQVFTREQVVDMRGTYNLVLDDEYLSLEIGGELEKPTAKINLKTKVSSKPPSRFKLPKKLTKTEETEEEKEEEITCNIAVQGLDLSIQFSSELLKWKGSSSLHGKLNTKFGVLEGDALLADGRWMRWTAVRGEKHHDKKKDDKDASIPSRKLKLSYPNMAYGFVEKPKQETIVITNATLWTNEKEGVLQNGSIVIEKGKITYVGTGNYATPRDATVYDAKGKHLTSGIIDEHSHIAISRGVNEGGQAITSEVSIGHVVDPEDIDIYRQLSGGVTASQLLHGSANPIGGQSAMIKLKWGHPAEEMLVPNAAKFIKFALGENVKQSNWGIANPTRFPQTRMGVEQIYYDAFNRAHLYEAEKKKHPTTYRVDLELEALSEILKKERFITCHSYIQSEINMLIKVADSMHFKLNTFTHILEGYKVADKMKKHGAGASTFADWWAYKYEVNDAIPYNAALLDQMGIVTAINSDDAEMGRRLNQEAAKAVKYGGLSQESAWKTVTLNPAKLLHLDERMGSLKVGKDADIVLWSDNPLSIRAKVEMTIIDGEILFETKRDEEMRQTNAQERARIISLMVEANKNGGGKKPFKKKKSGHFHCNTLGEEVSEGENQH